MTATTNLRDFDVTLSIAGMDPNADPDKQLCHRFEGVVGTAALITCDQPTSGR